VPKRYSARRDRGHHGDRDQNRIEEALKTYRELAQKDPQTFLPEVALTLNNLGILDSGQNRMKEARGPI
jgi:hypothetical protein